MPMAMGVMSSSLLLLLEVVVGVIALVAHRGYRRRAGGRQRMVVVAINVVVVVALWHQPSASCHCHHRHPCPVVVVAGDIKTDGGSGGGSKMAAGIETDGSGIVKMDGWCWLVMSKQMVVVAHCGSKMGRC